MNQGTVMTAVAAPPGVEHPVHPRRACPPGDAGVVLARCLHRHRRVSIVAGGVEVLAVEVTWVVVGALTAVGLHMLRGDRADLVLTYLFFAGIALIGQLLAGRGVNP